MTASPFGGVVLCGISTPFGMLSPAQGQVTHVLLTRAPLYRGRSPFSCDLHVLGAPLTFVLSQDQTLQLNFALALASCEKSSKDLILEIQSPRRLVDLTFSSELGRSLQLEPSK